MKRRTFFQSLLGFLGLGAVAKSASAESWAVAWNMASKYVPEEIRSVNGVSTSVHDCYTDNPAWIGKIRCGRGVNHVFVDGVEIDEPVTALKTGPNGSVEYFARNSAGEYFLDYERGDMIRVYKFGRVEFKADYL